MDNEDEEFLFNIPIYENDDLYSTIENMLEELKNSSSMANIENTDNGTIFHLDIEFEFLEPVEDTNKDETNYFKNCKEINDKLGKPEKIKKNDPIIDTSCLICYEEFKTNQFKRTLPECSHFFHKKCVDKWLKKKGNCPICRKHYI